MDDDPFTYYLAAGDAAVVVRGDGKLEVKGVGLGLTPSLLVAIGLADAADNQVWRNKLVERVRQKYGYAKHEQSSENGNGVDTDDGHRGAEDD